MSLSRTLSEVIAGRRKDAGGRETRSQISDLLAVGGLYKIN